jgi:hypothetical protein
VTSAALTFALFDEVPLADLSTFVLCVVEKEKDLDVFGELVVDFVYDKVEMVVVDRRTSCSSSLEGACLDNTDLKLRLTVLVLWGVWSGREKTQRKGLN